MDRAAQLISLARGNIHGIPGAIAQIYAVGAAAGRAVITGGHNFVIAHNDGPVAAPQAGGALQYRFRDVQIIIFLVDASHTLPSPRLFLQYSTGLPPLHSIN
ncbi:hypothetical protein SDC9_61443 [bioreactor metagenome]|uniref:Uncharacterized protein n=1 Tax=bioreactor metagenome TaxID=1076179 RepID=A0A644XGN8_9ZZZZ